MCIACKSHGNLSNLIQAIQEEYRRQTGHFLSADDAIREVDRLEDWEIEGLLEPLFVPRDLEAVEAYLASQGYGREARRDIIRDLAVSGSAWCSGRLEDEDIAEVEKLLPGSAYQWPSLWDEELWCPVGHAECCGCPPCLHEAAGLEAMGAALA